MRTAPLLFLVLLAQAASAAVQSGSIINSPHNLSASGPGSIRASSEAEICIFCHTPHNAAPVQPLWNRAMPASSYTIYSSSTLQARPGQPTGSSKLCLSCHDGTIALGSVLSRDMPIQMASGITTIPPGASRIGTDLSDDHPISFVYDASLAARDTKLKDPAGLPKNVRLSKSRELQCSTCHEAHDNTFGKFLVMDNSNSQLCNTCHVQGRTDVVNHIQCGSCHQPHTAPSKTFLLRGATVTDTCLTCHSGGGGGSTQGVNIATDINKPSRHDTNSIVDQKDHIPNNIVCSDCHEPHTMIKASASAPAISPRLGSINGVNSSGAAIPKAQYEYEVCFKCHGDQAGVASAIPRQIVQNNTRLEFSPSAVSYHPVMAAGKNSMNVPSLRPGLTTSSMIYCSDCHSSDTGKSAGGSGASGPHGSGSRPLLIAGYSTIDQTVESANAYALCYKCHDRTQLLSNTSFSAHSSHIVDDRTPCSVCHDAHGISSAQGNTTNNAHLVNFDTSVVTRSSTGKIEYRSMGVNQGTCTLMCHNKDHVDTQYPVDAAQGKVRHARPAKRR